MDVLPERPLSGLQAAAIGSLLVLVVVVVTVALLLSMISCACQRPSDEEVGVEISGDGVVSLDGRDEIPFELTVRSESGDPVSGVQVLVGSGTLTLEHEPHRVDGLTDESGRIAGAVDRGNVSFRSNQTRGTLRFEVVVGSDSGYADHVRNSKLVVTR